MNEQQPTPGHQQQSAPESAQPFAAVRDNGYAAPPPPIQPKPAPAAQTPPPQNRIESRLAVAPVPPPRQRELHRRLSRTSLVWLISVPGAIVFLFLAVLDLCTTPEEVMENGGIALIISALGLLWVLITKLIYGSRAQSQTLSLYNEPRINDLYPQAAVSRGESGTIVLPYSDITLYEETADWITLAGPGGEIQWSAYDLTPPAANALQLYLRSRVPTSAMRVSGAFCARAYALAPIPALPSRGMCFARATAENRTSKVAWLRLSQALVRCAPLMWLLAINVALIIKHTIEFDLPVFNSPWVWFVVLSLVEVAAMFGLLCLDAATGKKKPNHTPEFLFCADGMWISGARGTIRFLRGTVTATRRATALEICLPSGFVRLPYRQMTDQACIFRFFDLSQ